MKMAPKLTEGEMRELIKEYKIEFRGLLSPSEWPDPYRNLFSQVRKVGSTEFDIYNIEAGADRSGREMRTRVNRLIDIARGARVRRVNEETLRIVEYFVFSRFNGHIKCSKCRNDLWIAKFSALPDDREEAEKSQRRYEQRVLCNCPPEQDWGDEPGDTLLFTNDSSKSFKYDPSDRLDNRGLPKRKPDRIFSLARTDSLDFYCKNGVARELRHTPCADSDFIYPFMVVEAKPESGGPGFEAVETQTAFPLRACVKLQDDLKNKTGDELKPLVWFISYQGDEWRIGAAVVEDDKFPIIDLWMGRSTSKDGALQLLHIMDFICDWARNIYRKQIKCCLLGGEENTRRYMSPIDASRDSTLELETPAGSFSYDTEPSLEDESFERNTPPFQDTVSEENIILDDSISVQNEQHLAPDYDHIELDEADLLNPYLRWTEGPIDSTQWTYNATIRHINMPVFIFTHFTIPEDEAGLIEFLAEIGHVTSSPLWTRAYMLIETFSDPRWAMDTTAGQILELEAEWLRYGSNHNLQAEEQNLRVFFRFCSKIRKSDWQTTRELECISCSEKAAQQLAKIVAMEVELIQIGIWGMTGGQPLLFSVFKRLRALRDHNPVLAVLTSTTLYLSRRTAEYGGQHGWVCREPSPSISALFTLLCPRIRNNPLFSPLFKRRSIVMEHLGGLNSEKHITQGTRSQLSGASVTLLCTGAPAILLRKGSHWPESTPQWCLMVLDTIEFDDNIQVGRNLFHAANSGLYFTFVSSDTHLEADVPKDEPITPGVVTAFLTLWRDDLMNQT